MQLASRSRKSAASPSKISEGAQRIQGVRLLWILRLLARASLHTSDSYVIRDCCLMTAPVATPLPASVHCRSGKGHASNAPTPNCTHCMI